MKFFSNSFNGLILIVSNSIIVNNGFSVTIKKNNLHHSLLYRHSQLQVVSTMPPPPTKKEEFREANNEINMKDHDEMENGAVTNAPKSYLDDGFVFGLADSGIERPKGKVAKIVVEGDSTETTPYQVNLVLSTFAFHTFIFLINSIDLFSSASATGDLTSVIATSIQFLLICFSSWVLADFGSGVLHWSVDNYGNGRTPIMGSIIAAFQGHHAAPWTITERGFCNNVYKLCTPFGIPTVLLIHLISGPATTIFFTLFCAVEILSQEFHKWSHTTKAEVPSWVNALQNLGITIPRTQHAQHHMAPYDGNYCIISGVCNEALDKSGFFRRLEHLVYKINGIESNAWKLDEDLRKKTLNGDYAL